MRLIDADRLLEPKRIEKYYHLKNGDVAIPLIDIKHAPTVEERKRGKWVRNFDGNEWYWFCSNCKEEWYEEDLLMGGNDFPNFCPNCGADMRGEEYE